jgi:hypothetical protein
VPAIKAGKAVGQDRKAVSTKLASGVYHIGEDQARSWMVASTSLSSAVPFDLQDQSILNYN